MINNIIILLLSVSMSSVGHIFLKKGMILHVANSIESRGTISLFWSISTNGWVLIGVLLHASALIVWLWALSKVDISFAYPFLAVGYVFVGLIAWLWLGEQLTPMRVLGMGVIIIGLLVLAKGG